MVGLVAVIGEYICITFMDLGNLVGCRHVYAKVANFMSV
jgi:hypothetical protein